MSFSLNKSINEELSDSDNWGELRLKVKLINKLNEEV